MTKRYAYGSVIPYTEVNRKTLNIIADIIKSVKIHLDDDPDFCLKSLRYEDGRLMVELTDDHQGDEYDQTYIDYLEGLEE